jgi:hypothetical protein
MLLVQQKPKTFYESDCQGRTPCWLTPRAVYPPWQSAPDV